MPAGTQKVSQPKKNSKPSVREIDQSILNRQRKAEMHRRGYTPKPASSMTKEYFEGLKIV